MVKSYLGLGSNVGDSMATLEKALNLLQTSPQIELINTSSVYRTSPVGVLDQPDFYNLVIEIHTDLLPDSLLQRVLEIEQKLHRKRDRRWGPRTIDVDILLYGNHKVNQKELQIPHPRMSERAFVLIPLYEIAGDVQISAMNNRSSLKKIISTLSPDQRVEKLDRLL